MKPTRTRFKPYLYLFLAFQLLTFFFPSNSTVQAETWSTVTIDTDVSQFETPTALAFDADGRPNIVFCDEGSDGWTYPLQWARYIGPDPDDWYITTLSLESGSNCRIHLQVDSQGSLAAFFSGRYGGWHLLRQEQGGWSETVPPFESQARPKLDSQDRPHALLCANSSTGSRQPAVGALVHRYYDGAAWVDQTLESGLAQCRVLDMQLGQGDRLHAIYQTSLTQWRYGVLETSGWQSYPLPDIGGPEIDFASLGVSLNGEAHIGYYNGMYLRYARRSAAGWQSNLTLDSSVKGAGWDISLKLDSQGRPHIAYFTFLKYDQGELRYVFFDGAAWHQETADANGFSGRGAWLALDGQDRPAISYWASPGVIKYAYQSPLPGALEPELTVLQGEGQPGSIFHFDAQNFPPNAVVQVSINGVVAGEFQVDGQGSGSFNWLSQGAAPGWYAVRLTVGEQEVFMNIHLSLDAPLLNWNGPEPTFWPITLPVYLTFLPFSSK